MTFPLIRQAREEDLAAINRIYNREVREGFATWELDEWSDERRLEWFRARTPEEEPGEPHLLPVHSIARDPGPAPTRADAVRRWQ